MRALTERLAVIEACLDSSRPGQDLDWLSGIKEMPEEFLGAAAVKSAMSQRHTSDHLRHQVAIFPPRGDKPASSKQDGPDFFPATSASRCGSCVMRWMEAMLVKRKNAYRTLLTCRVYKSCSGAHERFSLERRQGLYQKSRCCGRKRMCLRRLRGTKRASRLVFVGCGQLPCWRLNKAVGSEDTTAPTGRKG